MSKKRDRKTKKPVGKPAAAAPEPEKANGDAAEAAAAPAIAEMSFAGEKLTRNRLAKMLRTLYRRTGEHYYEDAAKDPGSPDMLRPDAKEPHEADFQEAATDMLTNLTERQVQAIFTRVGSGVGDKQRRMSDEAASKRLGISKKHVRELERNCFDPAKVRNPNVRVCLIANLMATRVGPTKPFDASAVKPRRVSREHLRKLTAEDGDRLKGKHGKGDKELTFDDETREKMLRLINVGLRSGYITQAKIIDTLPESLQSKDHLEDVTGMLVSEFKIQVLDKEPAKEEEVMMVSEADHASSEEDVDAKAEAALNKMAGMVQTTDIARMYMREMNNHRLLSRKEETEIAVRIECCLRLTTNSCCRCPAIVDHILETCDLLLEDELQAKVVLYGRFEEDLDSDQLRYRLEHSDELDVEMKPVIADKNEAYISPEHEDLTSQFLKICRKIKEFRTKTQNSPKGSRAWKVARRNMEKWLLSVRFTTPFVKNIAERTFGFQRRARELRSEMRSMLSRNLNYKTRDFDREFPKNVMNPNWIDELNKVRNLGNSAVNYIPEVRSRHEELVKLLNLIDMESIDEIDALCEEIRDCLRKLKEANDKMVLSNLRLVVSIAKAYQSRGLQFLDLIQEGNIGLMKAVDKFEYRRGWKFSTYATWWIRQAITRAIADQGRTIRVPVHMIESINKVNRTIRQLQQQSGDDPSVETIAQVLEIPVEKVKRAMSVAKEPISTETQVGDDDAVTIDFLADTDTEGIETTLENHALQEAVKEMLTDLHSERDKKVIEMRFGIGTKKVLTLDEIGRQMNLTRERVRQIETKVMKKLDHPRFRQRFTELFSN